MLLLRPDPPHQQERQIQRIQNIQQHRRQHRNIRLMDERYKENAVRAQLKALRIGFGIIFALLLFAGQARRRYSAYRTSSSTAASIGISVGRNA